MLSWSYVQALPQPCTGCSLVASGSAYSPFSLGTIDRWFCLRRVELFPDVKVVKQVAYCCNL